MGLPPSSSFRRNPGVIKLDMAESEPWESQGCAIENDPS